MMIDEATKARFFAKVDKCGPTVREELGPCWVWMACVGPKGYGRFSLGGGPLTAHRVSYEMHVGPIGDLCVLHRCDVPACVNPSHLWLGTIADNNADMVGKGRHPSVMRPECLQRGDGHYARTNPERLARGERHGLANQPDRIVDEVRRMVGAGRSQRSVSRELGIPQPTISTWVRGIRRCA